MSLTRMYVWLVDLSTSVHRVNHFYAMSQPEKLDVLSYRLVDRKCAFNRYTTFAPPIPLILHVLFHPLNRYTQSVFPSTLSTPSLIIVYSTATAASPPHSTSRPPPRLLSHPSRRPFPLYAFSVLPEEAYETAVERSER